MFISSSDVAKAFALWLLALCLPIPMVRVSLAQETLSERPNILLIVSDDQRPDTIAALGNPTLRTPHLDALARRSSVFRRASCGNPICTPSRGEILTGCSGFRSGVFDFGDAIKKGIAPLGQTLMQGGYDTCYVGKWHNLGRPSEHGYQQSKGLFGSGGAKWWKDQPDAHGRPVTGYAGWVFQTDDGELSPEHGVGLTPNISERFADAAIDAISQPRESPFFIHVNFTAPHDPLLIPVGFEKAYQASDITLPRNFLPRHPFDTGNMGSRDERLLPMPRTEADVRADLAAYYCVIEHLDQEIGRILQALDASGRRDNTLVIFTSDHGLAIGSHGLRGKQNMYEHTMNVPLFISGPGIPAGKTFDAQMYLRDLFPTLCELADVPLLNEIDGKSVVPIFRGTKRSIHEHVFGYFRNVQRMIRGDRWKLIHYPKIDQWQLFDLTNDPDEIRNVVDVLENQATVKELQQRLLAWQQDVGDPLRRKE